LIEANLQTTMLLPYFIKAWLKQAKVWQQLTNVLAKVWLDGSTIGSLQSPTSVRAGQATFNFNS
jgi:hypothetical protein